MLLSYLKQIKDPRRGQGQRYKLADVLLVSILAILSGAESYRDISRFMKLRLCTLNQWLGINWKAAPSKSLLGYILGRLDRKNVETSFRSYSKNLNQPKPALEQRPLR
jgi:hypothetical protein